MTPHSADYDDAIVAGADVDVRVTAYRGGEVIVESGLYDVGLTVQVDETAAVVRTLSGAIADPDGQLRPHLPTDPLAPFGVELLVEVGARVPSGAFEYVPVGTFRIQASGDGTLGPITVTGDERSAVIARARDEVPWVIAGSTPLADAFTDYATAKYPGLTVLVDPDSHGVKLPATPTVYAPGAQATDDPWQNLGALAARYARTARLDPLGRLVLAPVPDPATVDPVYEYVPGARNLARPATPIMDTTGVHNVAVVTWSGSSADAADIATVVVEVTDPASPVFPAAFGRSPYFLTSNLFTDVSQLAPAGQAILDREVSAAINVPFTAAPHPAHEPGDAVHYRSDLGGVDVVCALSRWALACDLRTASAYTTRVLR